MYASYADDGKTLGGSVHTVKETPTALGVSSKEIGLEINADKTKYLVMSGDQNVRKNHGIKIDNISSES